MALFLFCALKQSSSPVFQHQDVVANTSDKVQNFTVFIFCVVKQSIRFTFPDLVVKMGSGLTFYCFYLFCDVKQFDRFLVFDHLAANSKN